MICKQDRQVLIVEVKKFVNLENRIVCETLPLFWQFQTVPRIQNCVECQPFPSEDFGTRNCLCFLFYHSRRKKNVGGYHL